MVSGRLEQLKEMLEKNPRDPFLLYALAQEFTKLGEVGQALQYYEHLREEHPEYTGTYYHLGKLYERNNELEKAKRTYRKGLEMTRRLGAQHDYSELLGALSLIEDEDDEDDF